MENALFLHVDKRTDYEKIIKRKMTLMEFKKTFENERGAKQFALDDLGIASKDNELLYQIEDTRPNSKTCYTIQDWLEKPNNEVLDLFIYNKVNSKTVVRIYVKLNNQKCDVAIGLNPEASEYQNYCSRLQQNGWTQHDIPFDEIILIP